MIPLPLHLAIFHSHPSIYPSRHFLFLPVFFSHTVAAHAFFLLWPDLCSMCLASLPASSLLHGFPCAVGEAPMDVALPMLLIALGRENSFSLDPWGPAQELHGQRPLLLGHNVGWPL